MHIICYKFECINDTPVRMKIYATSQNKQYEYTMEAYSKIQQSSDGTKCWTAIHARPEYYFDQTTRNKQSFDLDLYESGAVLCANQFVIIELAQCANGQNKDKNGHYCFHTRIYTRNSDDFKKYWKRHKKDIMSAPKDGRLRNNYTIKKW